MILDAYDIRSSSIDIDVTPGLIRPGETVTVRVTGASAGLKSVWLHHHFLEGEGKVEEMRLTRRKDHSETSFTLQDCGNYFVSLDQHPVPYKSPYRYLAVIDDSYHIFRFAITLTPEDYSEDVHGNFLTADYWPFLPRDTQTIELMLRFEADFGDEITPFFFPADFAKSLPGYDLKNPNWYVYDDKIIEHVLTEFRRMWQEFGFKHTDAFATYCHSAGLVRVASSMGFSIIGCLTPDQNHRDGNWEINHTAMPTLPYFPSSENFRIPQSPSSDRVMLVHQMSPCPPLGHDYCLNYCSDISCLNREDTSFELGKECWRAFDIMDTYIDTSRTIGGLDVTSLGIERVGAGTIVEYNRQVIQRVKELAKQGKKVAVANSRSLRDYYLRNCKIHPERVFCLTDVFAGVNYYGKPILYPDSICIDEQRLHAVFVYPMSSTHYHYSRLQEDGRNMCYIDDVKTSPLSNILEGLKVDIVRVQSGCTVRFEFNSLREMRAMPLCAWDLPVRPERIDWSLENLSIHAVKSPFKDRWHLVVVGPVSLGRNCWNIFVQGQTVESSILEVRSENWVLKEFPNSKPCHTYLIKTSPGKLEIDVDFPFKKNIILETHFGKRTKVHRSGKCHITLTESEPCIRIWGIGASHINIRQEKFSALNLGDYNLNEDSLRLQSWFRDTFLQPEDRVLLALECFRERIYGQRQHVWHENHISVDGYGLSVDPCCVDYSQAWGPGHTGWVQPQWLNVAVKGLSAFIDQRIIVFLHCYSPDGVDRAYNIIVNRSGEQCLAKGFWRVPRGTDGRFDPLGVIGWELPKDIISSGEVNLLISPLRRPWNMIHHWIREGGFSSILNDLWVVQINKTARESLTE